MEKQVLNILNFDLYSPTAIAFIKLYNSVLKVNTKVLLCACYLADLMLLPTLSNKYNPSLMGSTCLFVAHLATNHSLEVNFKWTKNNFRKTRYNNKSSSANSISRTILTRIMASGILLLNLSNALTMCWCSGQKVDTILTIHDSMQSTINTTT